jgi:hypothetical protein
MKNPGFGNQIIEEYLLEDWHIVKRYSQFTKNRHTGKGSIGLLEIYKAWHKF